MIKVRKSRFMRIAVFVLKQINKTDNLKLLLGLQNKTRVKRGAGYV